MQTFKYAIFDMDGTILNSVSDIEIAINYVMKKYGYKTFNEAEIMSMLGNGNKKLVERALPEGLKDKHFDEKYKEFLDYYFSHCKIKSKPYDGIIDLFHYLKDKGIKTAIVSNKNDAAVQELKDYYFKGLIDVAVGITANMKVKPDPEPVEKALKALKATKEDSLYMGDSEVDAKTAENSGLKYLSVSWGFRSRDILLKLHPIEIVDKPEDIKKYF